MRRRQIFLLFCGISAAFPAAALEPTRHGQFAGMLVAEAAPLPPPILSREQWHANPPAPGMQPQKVVGIIIHHAGVRKNLTSTLEGKMRGLQSFSQNPGKVSPTLSKPAWPDVPYHFYVDAHGKIAEGRDVRFAGDSNTNYRTEGFLQVVVEGDFDKEMPDPSQLAALRDLLAWLMVSWDIGMDSISTHKDHAQTSCPGRNLLAALPSLMQQVQAQRRKLVEEYCQSAPAASRRPICRRDRVDLAR
jgi:N-acetylmuramoyl-L-alanine amidase-like protein